MTDIASIAGLVAIFAILPHVTPLYESRERVHLSEFLCTSDSYFTPQVSGPSIVPDRRSFPAPESNFDGVDNTRPSSQPAPSAPSDGRDPPQPVNPGSVDGQDPPPYMIDERYDKRSDVMITAGQNV